MVCSVYGYNFVFLIIPHLCSQFELYNFHQYLLFHIFYWIVKKHIVFVHQFDAQQGTEFFNLIWFYCRHHFNIFTVEQTDFKMCQFLEKATFWLLFSFIYLRGLNGKLNSDKWHKVILLMGFGPYVTIYYWEN